MYSISKRLVSGLLAATMLAGCSVGNEATRNIRASGNEAGSLIATASRPAAVADHSTVKVNDGVFVGSKSVRNENGDPLPSRFEGTAGITLVRSSPASLREVASAITEHTKIPVVLAAAAPAGQSQQAEASAPPTPGFAAGPVPDDFPMQEALAQLSPASPAQSITANFNVPEGSMALNYSGPLSGLLDIVASNFNVAWRHQSGRIILDTVVTRSFDVPALAMTAGLNFQVGTSGSGSSTQQATSESSSNVFEELNEGLQSLVGEGSFNVNRTTGVVTVTSTPAIASRVGSFISEMNAKLANQVAVSIKVYSVTLHDAEEFDLDVQGLFNKAGHYGLALGSGGSGGIVPATGGSAGPGLGWALLNTNSEWSGSNALVSALSTRGDVSVVTTAAVTTVSGVPVPLQVGEERDYVKEITSTPVEGSDPQISFATDTVSTGFSLQVIPRVERNGDVLLQYGINISELTGANDGFDHFSIAGNEVMLKRVNQRNFIQQARIPNNNTLVLAGFEQVRNESIKRGVGRANFPLFGGGGRSALKREIIVIMITPTVLKTN